MKPYLKFLPMLALLLALLALPVSADMGPKPSVRMTVTGLEEETCYATLLSKTPSTGPYSAWDGKEENAFYYDFPYEIWKEFAEYRDPDGYYFLQMARQIDPGMKFAWTYYPPKEFKLLLYFPERDEFIVSPPCSRYAFDSYFTVELTEEGTLSAPKRSYDYRWELLSLVARIAATILVEIGLALLFGYREKRQLLFLAGMNAVTQILLNVALNTIDYYSGYMAFLFAYVELELLVFALEATLCAILLNRFSERKRHPALAVLYALVANALSFGAGLGLAVVIPGIF